MAAGSATGAAKQGPERYVYADNAATTPLSPAALEAMLPYLTDAFGNPSGIHRVSREAARALDDARERTAELIGASEARELYFTSGGSESDTWVVLGAVRRFRDLHGDRVPARIVTSAIEHHAILHACDAAAREGAEVIVLPVDGEGRVDPADLDRALGSAAARDRVAGVDAPPAALATVMLANNEVGTIEDVRALAEVAHAHGVPFHTDAVQAAGHIPVDAAALGVDALSLSAHKFHGPRGVGALYLREGFSIPALVLGGAQERGERAGTENVAGAVGMAAALEAAVHGLEGRMARVAAARDAVMDAVCTVPDVRVTGPAGEGRLPGTASFVCRDVDGELLVVLLDRAGVAAATGSACSTGSTDPSHVILALGINDPSWARGSLRLSLADDVSDEDVAALCERVPAAILRARAMSGPMAP